MTAYEELRSMESTYMAAAEERTNWSGDRTLGLARMISILSGYLADLMIPVAPIAPPPPADDEHVAAGCLLFSDPTKVA